MKGPCLPQPASKPSAPLPASVSPSRLCPAVRSSPARKASTFASGTRQHHFSGRGSRPAPAVRRANGRNHALRAADALGQCSAAEGLKGLVREKRPDSNAHDCFPSGHATAAFAVATVESELHPNQAPLWYLGARLISDSRVRLHRHTVGDVLAGAALGFGTARLELSQPRGLVLSPFITPDGVGYSNHTGAVTLLHPIARGGNPPGRPTG